MSANAERVASGGVLKAPPWLCGYVSDGVLCGRSTKRSVKVGDVVFYVTGKMVSGILERLEREITRGRALELPGLEETVVYIAAMLNSNLRLNDLLSEIQEEICNVVGADAASIMLRDGEHLKFFVTVGRVSGKIESIPVPMNSIAGTIYNEGKPMVFNDLVSNPLHFKGVDKVSHFKTENIAGSPIWVENEKIGVLEVLNKKGGFDEEDSRIVDLFARLIGKKLLSTWRYEKFSSQYKNILLAIASAIDKRDNYTHQHSKNVAFYSVEIGRKLGLSQEKLEKLEFSAILHDVGKIGIPDNILRKPGKLDEREFDEIKRHTEYGAEILSRIRYVDDDVVKGALEHHERLDGSGYPTGKSDGDISLFGRIVGVADVFDALSSRRVYKEAWSIWEAFGVLEAEAKSGKLDPEIVEKLREVVSERFNERK